MNTLWPMERKQEGLKGCVIQKQGSRSLGRETPGIGLESCQRLSLLQHLPRMYEAVESKRT